RPPGADERGRRPRRVPRLLRRRAARAAARGRMRGRRVCERPPGVFERGPFRPDPGPQPRPPAVQAPPAVRRRLVELDAAVTAEGGCAGEGGGGRGGPRRTPFSQGGVVPHFRVGLDAAGVPGRSGGLAASRPTGVGGVPPSARAGFTEGEWGSRGRDGAVSRPRRRCPGCAGPPPSAPAAPRGTAPTRGSRVRPGRSWRC